jgi:hypothetical protein
MYGETEAEPSESLARRARVQIAQIFILAGVLSTVVTRHGAGAIVHINRLHPRPTQVVVLHDRVLGSHLDEQPIRRKSRASARVCFNTTIHGSAEHTDVRVVGNRKPILVTDITRDGDVCSPNLDAISVVLVTDIIRDPDVLGMRGRCITTLPDLDTTTATLGPSTAISNNETRRYLPEETVLVR